MTLTKSDGPGHVIAMTDPAGFHGAGEASRLTARVLLVCEHPLLRWGLRAAVSYNSMIEVVGDSPDLADAGAHLARFAPDVLVADLTPSSMEFTRSWQALIDRHPRDGIPRLLLIVPDSASIPPAISPCPSHLLLADATPANLVAAIRVLASGYSVVPGPVISGDGHVARGVEVPGQGKACRPELGRLTNREREVLRHLVRGYTNHEIASTLRVSESTVKSHVQNVLNKLSLRDRVQAVIYAYELGLADSSPLIPLATRHIGWDVVPDD